MIDLSKEIRLQTKPVGHSKENKMVKRYDVLAKKWFIGFWIGRTFKIIGEAD
ncbi:MAG: hypothetical protein RLZZ196_1615 [Bacteroidota bacterium]|jgi:hypothetical protein